MRVEVILHNRETRLTGHPDRLANLFDLLVSAGPPVECVVEATDHQVVQGQARGLEALDAGAKLGLLPGAGGTRWEQVTLAAALLGILPEPSRAQVYSINIVGYYNVTVVPGWNLLANQLRLTNMTANYVLIPSSPVADGSLLYRFNPTNQNYYDAAIYYTNSGVGWYAPSGEPDDPSLELPLDGKMTCSTLASLRGAGDSAIDVVGDASAWERSAAGAAKRSSPGSPGNGSWMRGKQPTGAW